jgi:hypothetical protein
VQSRHAIAGLRDPEVILPVVLPKLCGIVVDWNDGRLAPRRGDAVSRSVSLRHDDGAAGFPLGEGTCRSDDACYPKQGGVLSAGEIVVGFDDPDAK